MGVTRSMDFVYVGQMGGFWRLTRSQWKALCERAIRQCGYDLSDYHEIQKPRWLIKCTDSPGYMLGVSKAVLYYEPVDWTAEDFKHALAELGE